MRIGELARKTGLSRDTIRFYERAGLIESHPSKTARNTYRDYPERLVEELTMITAARNAGFSVADVQLFVCGAATDDLDFDYLETKIAELELRQRQTRHLLSLLRQTKAAIAKGPVEWRE